MTDIPESNQEKPEDTAGITPYASTTPTKITVNGFSLSWGYDGSIEFEYFLDSADTTKLVVKTLRYYFEGGVSAKNPRFEIISPGGGILGIVPSMRSQWLAWNSTLTWPYAANPSPYTVKFIFYDDLNGVIKSSTKIVNL